MSKQFQFPHCDARILHAPEDGCKFCNESGLQEVREVWEINFTGHYEEGKVICPAERHRDLGTINKWHGNVAFTPEVQKAQDEYYRVLREHIGDIQSR